MAKVKFGELNGVCLRSKECESVQRSIVCESLLDEYDIVSRGDVIFEIDLDSKAINRCGVIVGDSEKKIKVLDEEEAKVGKNVVDWFRDNRGGFEESKGIHILERVNVLRIKEAVKS